MKKLKVFLFSRADRPYFGEKWKIMKKQATFYLEKAAHKKNGLVIKTDKFNIIKVADQDIVGLNLVK